MWDPQILRPRLQFSRGAKFEQYVTWNEKLQIGGPRLEKKNDANALTQIAMEANRGPGRIEDCSQKSYTCKVPLR